MVDLPYTRDPSEQIQTLLASPKKNEVTKPPIHPRLPKLATKEDKDKQKEEESELEAIMNQRNRLISNTTLANKDFEYIKPPPIAPRKGIPQDRVNPIVELKMRGKNTENTGSEDEPPFNFQKMLRKTNYQRGSLKRAVENFKIFGGDKEHVNYNGVTNGDAYVKLELAPGIILQGIVTDL